MSKTTNTKPKSTSKPIPKEVLDQLLEGYQGPHDLLGADGLFKRLTAALINRAMEAELSHHLGYEPGKAPPGDQPNRRNGKGSKTVRSNFGDLEIEVPRDRDGTFEPQLIPKHQRAFDGFDDQVVSMYARGMSTREIRDHLHEIYGVHVSPDLISRATDSIVDELKSWQGRPLDAVYPIVYLDALMVKIRDTGVVRSKAVYLVVGVDLEGRKNVLGMWLQRTEGAKFWLAILNELRERGVKDVFVLCADGLKGLPEAVEAAFPRTIFQSCVVHMIRSSTRFVPWKERKAVCADLRLIYTAPNEQSALQALDSFEAKWGKRFPMIAKAWRARWAEISPFLDFPPEIRRAIYTTNAIEALNRQVRKVLKTRGHMPTDAAAMKLVYLAIRNAQKSWGNTNRMIWSQAYLQLAILFEDRIPNA